MSAAVYRQVAAGGMIAATALLAAVISSPAAVLAAIANLADAPVVFLAVLVVLYLLRPLVLWPISALSILAGFSLGLPAAFPVGLAGAVLTSLPPYVLARRAPRETGLFAHLHSRGRQVVDIAGELRGVVALRLVPLPADPVSYGLGLTGVTPGRYVLGTLLGETPWVIAAVLAGASMRTLTVAGTGEELELIVGAAAMGVLLLAGPAVRHLQRAGRLPSLESLGS